MSDTDTQVELLRLRLELMSARLDFMLASMRNTLDVMKAITNSNTGGCTHD